MKKLQNNFTTPEQSKRLLELGIPADSADMHYHQECVRMKYGKEEFEYFIRYGKPDTNKYSTDIPCWSVGRLMEIYDITINLIPEDFQVFYNESRINRTKFIEALIEAFELAVDNVAMDFSKLEE